MKKYAVLMILFFLNGCAIQKDVVPRKWISGISNIEEIHEDNYSLCLSIQKLKVFQEGEYHPTNIKCNKGAGNPFKHPLKAGYKIYRYDSPKQYWEGLSGSRGFLLEIDGKIVESIETAVN